MVLRRIGRNGTHPHSQQLHRQWYTSTTSTFRYWGVLFLVVMMMMMMFSPLSTFTTTILPVIHATTTAFGSRTPSTTSSVDMNKKLYENDDLSNNNNNSDVSSPPDNYMFEPPSKIPWIRINGSNQQQHVQLDFSGRIRTHVMGPLVLSSSSSSSDHISSSSSSRSYDDNIHARYQPPIVSWKVEIPSWYRRLCPSIFLNTDYDFTKSWYGVQQLGVTLRLQGVLPPTTRRHPSSPPINNNNNNNNNNNVQAEWFQRATSRLCPAWVDVTKQCTIPSTAVSQSASSTVIACQWPSICGSHRTDTTDQRSSDFISMEVTKLDTPSAKLFETAIVQIPLHQRIRFECRLFNGCMLPRSSSKTKQPTHQNFNPVDKDDDWWIPNVRIDALGLMESTNHYWTDQQNIGLTLSLRRKLNWSALGWFGGERHDYSGVDDSMTALDQTRIQLRVQCCYQPHVMSSMVELTSQLGQPLQTARLLLRQDVALSHFS